MHLDSASSMGETPRSLLDTSMKPLTHIYDDPNQFLDYLATRLRFDVSQGRKLIFVSQNISLQHFIAHFFADDHREMVLYNYHYFYLEMD